jgi:hypothetical protein
MATRDLPFTREQTPSDLSTKKGTPASSRSLETYALIGTSIAAVVFGFLSIWQFHRYGWLYNSSATVQAQLSSMGVSAISPTGLATVNGADGQKRTMRVVDILYTGLARLAGTTSSANAPVKSAPKQNDHQSASPEPMPPTNGPMDNAIDNDGDVDGNVDGGEPGEQQAPPDEENDINYEPWTGDIGQRPTEFPEKPIKCGREKRQQEPSDYDSEAGGDDDRGIPPEFPDPPISCGPREKSRTATSKRAPAKKKASNPILQTHEIGSSLSASTNNDDKSSGNDEYNFGDKVDPASFTYVPVTPAAK